MTEEQTPQPDVATPEPAESNVPQDFKGYVKFRKTGELPEATEPEQPAAAEETPAKTEPQSGADDTQQPDDEEEEELTASQKRRRRRIDRLAAENEQLKQQLAAVQQPPAKAEPPPGKPRLEAFDTLEAYQEALTDWHINQREAKRQADADAKSAQEAEQKLQTEWDSRQKTARKAHPDYDDVINTVTAPEGPGVAAARQAMLEDEAGAEILYYLATHKDELKRIAALSPLAAVRAIGRLSATLSPSSNGAANGKQRFTSAPPPPPPNTRPAKAVSDSIFDPAVQADFKRWAKARAAMKDT